MSTILEALAAVHAEQGYLILNSYERYEKGDVSRAGEVGMPGGSVKVHQPVTIVGLATPEDWWLQNKRLDQLLHVNTPVGYNTYPYFYKVVATD
jgi:hypothetical protein